MKKHNITVGLEKAYVTTMMTIVGRALISASQYDDEVRREIAGMPTGYVLSMTVMPSGPGFTLRAEKDGSLTWLSNDTPADLTIRFKHLEHAFMVFSFQESTSRAFANDRMIADGEVSQAIRLVRCLNKLESIILPKVVAKLAVKRYPEKLAVGEKFSKALRIYAGVTQQIVKGR
ncbi:conserved hypothetical protein [gamma proteobacterium HTCC5015]|nr:conserved hypothetical protein [gamma proteobacterium HTCC5015]